MHVRTDGPERTALGRWLAVSAAVIAADQVDEGRDARDDPRRRRLRGHDRSSRSC